MGTGTFGGNHKMAEAQHDAELEAYRGRQLRDSAEAMRDESRGSTHLTH